MEIKHALQEKRAFPTVNIFFSSGNYHCYFFCSCNKIATILLWLLSTANLLAAIIVTDKVTTLVIAAVAIVTSSLKIKTK